MGGTLYPEVFIDTKNPDPTKAINAFLWCMAKARELRMMPRTEHTLAEHLFRGDASLIFYSSAGGITALCMDANAMNDDDAFEMIEWVAARRKKRLAEKRAAQGIEAATAGETREAGLDPTDESPVAESDAPEMPDQ